jgi:hypothetical protein
MQSGGVMVTGGAMVIGQSMSIRLSMPKCFHQCKGGDCWKVGCH